MNSIYPAYIGDEVLPQGLNPFLPIIPSPEPPTPTPSDSSLTWLWILLGCLFGIAIIGLLGMWAYKTKKTKAQQQEE